MKKALATFAYGPMVPVGNLTINDMQKYGKKHGYDVYSPGRSGMGLEGFDPEGWDVTQRDKHPSWAKLEILRRLFDKGYDWILWADSDILMVNVSKDILSEVGRFEDPDLVYAMHHTPYVDWQIHPNAGMFLVHNPSILDDFETLARDTKEDRAARAWDQPGLLKLIGIDVSYRFDKNRASKEPEPPWKPYRNYHFQEVGHEWNFTKVDKRPVPHPVRFAHYCGMNNNARIEQIKARRMGGIEFPLE